MHFATGSFFNFNGTAGAQLPRMSPAYQTGSYAERHSSLLCGQVPVISLESFFNVCLPGS